MFTSRHCGDRLNAVTYLSAAMFFVNMASGACWTLAAVAVPRRLVASLDSIQNFGGYFGGAFAPLVTGIVVDRTHSFTGAFVISAVVAVFAALVYAFAVKPSGKGYKDITAVLAKQRVESPAMK